MHAWSQSILFDGSYFNFHALELAAFVIPKDVRDGGNRGQPLPP